MDSSIRLYNLNSRLHSVLDTEQTGCPTKPLLHEENSSVEAAPVEEIEREPDAISQHSVDALQEQVQRLDVADFEAIFLRFQVPITIFNSHLIANRYQPCNLTNHSVVH